MITRTLRRYGRVAGTRGFALALSGLVLRTSALVRVTPQELGSPVYMRVPSTDVRAFEQIFIKREYEFPVTRAPRTIVDAGANIGVASLYFASKFPDAHIVAIEPEAGNFELLCRNTAAHRNITAIRAALWDEDKTIELLDPHRGAWSFTTEAAGNANGRHADFVEQVPGMTVDTIMRRLGIEHIDILKIDIEGAEREVLRDPSAWIGRVDTLVVELHERLKLGCNRSFYNATNGFDDEWIQGENVYVTRTGACVAPRAHATPRMATP